MTVPNPLSSFKNWIILLLLAGCIFLLLTRGCNKPNPAITQNKLLVDTVRALEARANDACIQAGILMEDTDRLSKAYKLRGDSLQQATRIIHAANSQVSALANEVVNARLHNDTMAYIHACDSLPLVIKEKDGKFAIFERDNKNALKAANELSAKKSAIITSLSSEANGFKAAGQLLKKQNDLLTKNLTPKAKVYVGGEAWTCPVASGIGPGILYEDKRERLYGLSGGIATTGGWWFGGKAYIKIQLHK